MMDYFNPNDAWIRHDDYHYKNLTDHEQVNQGCMQAVVYFIAFIIGILICSLFSSCKSVEYVTVIEHKTDTLIQTKVQYDSVWLHDSIVQKHKEDTLLIEKWHTKYVEKQVHDTTYVSKTDSVPVPYPVMEYVEKQLTWCQQARLHLANVVLYLLLIIAGIWLVQKFK